MNNLIHLLKITVLFPLNINELRLPLNKRTAPKLLAVSALLVVSVKKARSQLVMLKPLLLVRQLCDIASV